MKKSILIGLLIFLISGVVYYLWPEQKLPLNQRIDKIVVNKGDREMIVYFHNEEIARYSVSLGSTKWPNKEWGPFFCHDNGAKNASGDAKTPEGTYNLSPNFGKNYRPALRLNYEAKHPGKGCCILIHGPNSINKLAGKFMRWIDWTDGCIALTEFEIQEICNAVKKNCEIEINH